jgi:predicted nicotinamide N-methyase
MKVNESVSINKEVIPFLQKALKEKGFALFSFKPTREEDLEKDLLAFIILCGSYFSSVGSRLMLRVRFDDPNNKKITY